MRRHGNSGRKLRYSVKFVAEPATCCDCEVDRHGTLVASVFPASHNPDLVDEFGSPEIAERVAGRFAQGFLNGVLRLVTQDLNSRLPPSLSYIREFAKAMFTYWLLCERVGGRQLDKPPARMLQVWMTIAEQTPKLERLRVESLQTLWDKLQGSVHRTMNRGEFTVRDIAADWEPRWGKVGQLVLRLDDVVENRTHPFTLSASYYDAITSVQFDMPTPITAVVFGEPPIEGLREYVLDLLKAASTRNEVIRRLVASQSIFTPCRLIPRDAHALVRDAEALEALGIEVKLPRWWKELKQPEIHVRARVGTSAPNPIAAERLLDLETSYVVGEHELTEAEWRRLVANGQDGLTLINGTWVDLTRSRIQSACAASKTLDEHRERGGVTYAEAIELTGADLSGGRELEADAESPSQGGIPTTAPVFEPGAWLDAARVAIAQRDFRRGSEPGVRLRGELFGYQRQGVAWLSTLMEAGVGACLADDMGLGKTLQTIALLVVLLRKGVEGPHLVVVPASLIANWEQEFARFAPTMLVATEHGSAAPLDPKAPPFVVLTSYGTLQRRDALRERAWSLVVLDEAQEIKNPRTLIARTVFSLGAKMRICLTGTPVENDLIELWSLMNFLNPGALGGEAEFRRWCGEHLEGPGGMALLRKRVRPFFLRRLKSDPLVALDLPSKVGVTVYCGLTPLQSDLYGQIYASMRRDFERARPGERQGCALNVIGKLKQICDHPAMILGDQYDAPSSGKFLRLRQLALSIRDGGDRMLVFTQYKRMSRALAAFLGDVLGREGLVIDGGIPERKRQELVDAFQRDDGPPFMVLTYKTGGTGFTLTAACHVILFDRWWNYAREVQAVDRAYRIGQTKGVVVHRFVCRGTLEERIVSMIERKRELVEQLFAEGDDGDEGISKLSPEELLSLCALDPALAELEEDAIDAPHP